jgi:hypothetical protein
MRRTLALLLAATLAGCDVSGGGGQPGGGATPGTSPRATPGSSPEVTGVAGGGEVPAALVQRASADAARRAGVPATQVAVAGATAREWGDGSLGCPEPGRAYTQAIVPGYLIVLTAGGQRFEYHADRRGQLILCLAGRPQSIA